MDALIVVEVLDKSGAVRERHRFTQFPVSIGRGYGNALIVDDEYVSAHHGEIVLEGESGLAYHDLGSENGSVLDGVRTTHQRLRADQTLRLGNARLRLRTADFVVAPAKKLAAEDERLLAWQPGWLLALGLAGALTALLGLLVYGLEFKDPHASVGVGVGLALLLVLGLWAGVWALVGRLFVQRTAFRVHLAVAAIWGLAAVLLSVLVDDVSLLGSYVPLLKTLFEVVVFVPALFGVAAHVRLATHLGRRQALLRTLGFFVAIAVVLGVSSYASDLSYHSKPDMDQDVQPLPPALLHGKTPAQFFEQARGLEKETQQAP